MNSEFRAASGKQFSGSANEGSADEGFNKRQCLCEARLSLAAYRGSG